MPQVVELNLAQLAELGGKARFFRERLDKVGSSAATQLLLAGWRLGLPGSCCLPLPDALRGVELQRPCVFSCCHFFSQPR